MPVFRDSEVKEGDTSLGETLGTVYFERKDLQVHQDSLRKQFFEQATNSFNKDQLATKTVEIPDDQLSDIDGYIDRYFPEWDVVYVSHEGDTSGYQGATVTIRENPEFKSYSEVIQVPDREGFVISRSVASGQIYIDEDRLLAKDENLWWRVTDWDNKNLIDLLGFDDSKLIEVNWPRIIKSPDDMTPDQIENIKPYLYQGKPTAKLLVRYAKKEDLEEVDA